MRKHISVFAFLLCAFAAVGLAESANAVTAGYPYYKMEGTAAGDASVVYSTNGVNYTAIPPAGRKVGNWGWADDGSSAQQYKKVNWESPAKTGTTYAVPAEENKAAVYFDYIPLTVSFDGNGSTSGKMDPLEDLNCDSDITLPTNTFAKTGCHFSGWRTNSTEGVLFEDEAKLTGADLWNGTGFNSTFYVQWEANEYKISYSNLGDASDYPKGAKYGEEIRLPEPHRDGLTFAGWNIAAGLMSPRPEWHQDQQQGWSTISTTYQRLQADGGNPDKTVWLRNLNTNDQATVTVNANWTTNSYKINLKFEGARNNPTKEVSVKYGSIPGGVDIVPEYDSGMVFTGYADSQGKLWYGADGKLTAEFADYHWDRTADLELTAQKGGIEYYLTYDANAKHGGSGTEPKQTCNTAGEVTLSDGSNMSNPHHSLVGWNKNPDTSPDALGANFVPGGHPSYSELGVTKDNTDITLYAIWRDRRVTIGINAAGGKAFTNGVEVTEIVYADDEKYGFLPTAERPKYKFDGWYSAATGGTLIEPDMIVSKADVPVLYAHWSPEKFYVRFDGNGASNETEMAVQEFVFNEEKPLLPNEYGRVGYDFTGWATNATDKTKVYEDGQVVSNLAETVGATNVLYALWGPHHYTITFDANGGKGENPKDKDCTYGEKVTLPSNPYSAPKNYATFAGWSTNKSDAVGVDTVSNLTTKAGGIVTVYAIWSYDVGEWSRVLDCDNLKFENGGTVPWVALTNDYGGLSPSYARHIDSSASGKNGILSAVVDASGTLSFWWKAVHDEDWLTVEYRTVDVDPQMLSSTNLLWRSDDWVTDSLRIDLPSGMDVMQVRFVHGNPADIYLDCVTWTPDVKVPTAVEGLVYDGTEKTGVLPGVGYSLVGNVATNAGDYTAVATVTNGVWEGGATGPTNIAWTIAKGTYDMSGVTFASATYEFDGKEHSIAVAGVPFGVEVVYSGDATNRTEVGTNTVTASFKVLDELNYNAITTQMVATLAITSREDPPEPPEPVVTNAVPVAVTGLVYDGTAKTGVVAGANYTIVGNVATNAGDYTAVATVTNGVWEGGATGPTNIAWTIAKGTYDMSGVTFASATYEFDGKEHSIAVAGVPSGVEVVYTGDATNRTAVGTNTVTASFNVLDELNYNAITTQMVATLAITSREDPPVPPGPPEPVVTNAVPVAVTGLVYDGTAKTGVAAGANYTIVGNVATNAGDYVAVATVTNGVWEGGATGPTNIAWTIAKGEPPTPPDPTVAYENIYFKATLAELGAEAVPTNRKITIKAEGLPKGLKLVTTTLKDGKNKATGYYAYTVEGAPTETMDGLSRIAYVRVTDNKVQTLYALDLSVLWAKAYEDKSFPDGEVKSEYANFSVTNLWPDVAAHPKNWTFSGWPTGIKFTTKAVTSRKKIDGVYVTLTNALAYEIYGTPTKAGRFTVKAVEKIDGTSYKSTHVATFTVWPQGAVGEAWTNQAYVAVVRESGTNVTAASGLPTGIKFTAKDVVSKSVVTAKAHTFYGTPTKADTYVVTLTHDDMSKTQFLWTITPAEAPAFELKLTETEVNPETAKATIRQGVSYDWAIDCTSNATVTASGLPTGLKLVKTAVKSGTKTIGYDYSVAGVPTKAGEFFVTFTTKLNGVSTVTTAAFVVLDLPAWAQGTFDGGADETFPVGGQVTFTVSKVGKLSGKWMSEGTNWTLSATSYDRYDEATGSYVAQMVGKTGSGKKAVAFTNETFVVADAVGGMATNGLFLAYQNNWKLEPWKSVGKSVAQAPTFEFHPYADAGDDHTNDVIALKFAASGKVTVKASYFKSASAAGKISWTTASGSAVLCPQTLPREGDTFLAAVFVYLPPKKNTPTAEAAYAVCIRLKWDGEEFRKWPEPE